MGLFDDLLKKATGNENEAYFQPYVDTSKVDMTPVSDNQNFLDSLLANQDNNPAHLYQQAAAANGPFKAPADTGGGIVPAQLPELKTNEPMPKGTGLPPQGMGDSLMQRSGDDMPKPVETEQLTIPEDTFRKEDAVVAAQKMAPPAEEPKDKELIDAQNKSNSLATLMMLMKGGNRLMSGMAGVKHDDKYMDEMAPLVNRPVEDVIAQRRNADAAQDLALKKFNFANLKDKDDPNSTASQLYRNSINALQEATGIDLKIPKAASALEMERIYPNIINVVNAFGAREAKLEAAKAAAETKKADKMVKRGGGMKEDLDPAKARAGVLSKVEAMINSADRIDGLFKQFPDYDIPASQTTELATATAGLISGGSPQSQQQINELVPHSMRGSGEKIAAWVTNEPRGQKQQKFMKLMHETALRERQIADAQKKSYFAQRIPAWQDVREGDPKQWETNIRAAGLDPADFDEAGLYIPMKNDKGILDRSQLMNYQPGHGQVGASHGGPAAKVTNKADGMVVVREIKTGRTKRVSPENAATILKDKNYEQVK